MYSDSYLFKLTLLFNYFFQPVVDLLDQHQADYDEANSTTYGAATSLRLTGEVNFNFREYDSYLDQFYRVRINSVNIHFNELLISSYNHNYFRFAFVFLTKINLQTFLKVQMVKS